ncbi:hypothetical protein SDC9_169442 [bioreactor metagenome]|uniref:Uncharacterized protein n=1 Tax=bioreactor metagenome TaxID=1076179 RepID=A0A645G8E6_9ZZZZ
MDERIPSHAIQDILPKLKYNHTDAQRAAQGIKGYRFQIPALHALETHHIVSPRETGRERESDNFFIAVVPDAVQGFCHSE